MWGRFASGGVLPHVTLSGVPSMPQQNLKTAVVVDAKYLFVAGPSTKTKSSAPSQSASETICRLTCVLAQTAYIACLVDMYMAIQLSYIILSYLILSYILKFIP